MKVLKITDVSEFEKLCKPFLMPKESFYNLKIGLCDAIKKRTLPATNPHFFVIENNNQITACALNSHSVKPLAISKMNRDEINFFVDYLFNQKLNFQAAVGEIETINYFTELYCKKFNLSKKLNIHLGIYQTDTIFLPNMDGEIFLATEVNEQIVQEFIFQFESECFPNRKSSKEEIAQIAQRHIKNRAIYLLKNKNSDIIAMGGNTRNSENAGTINLIFTPKQLRNNGYGSFITAKIALELLKKKKFVNLHTDLNNPTSNSIYQKIGFKFIGENIHYDFLRQS